MNAKRLAALAAVAYLATIVAANWAVHTIGPVPVAPGLQAPAGVYFVALALVLRDGVQYGLGRRWALAAMAAGVVLSAVVAGRSLAVASGAAFAVSELIDFGVFTGTAPGGGTAPAPVAARWRWAGAVLAAGTLALVADSVTFLGTAQWLAVPGITLAYLPGQILGKFYGVAAAALIITWRRRRRGIAETA